MDKSNIRITKAVDVTKKGLCLNIILAVYKLSAGVLGRSAAMIADGMNSLCDSVTDVILLLGFRMVDKPADKDHRYGHGKYETLVATILGVVIAFVGVKILGKGIESVISIVKGKLIASPGWIAFYAAVVSIIVKEWMYRFTKRVGQEINSKAIIANAWNFRSDVFSSFGTMFGIGGAIVLGEKWRILDPIAAIGVSFFIIKVAVKISIGSINELLEVSLSEEMEDKILQVIKDTQGVKQPHDMKTRMIGNNIAVDIHIEVDRALSIVQAHDIANAVEHKLKDSLGDRIFVSIHIEPAD